jgi:regulator of sigma E protease
MVMSWGFVQHFGLLGNVVVGFIIPFLFVLTIIVFIHELGHFLVARWCGIRVLVFSIGFGPELVGFNDRYGTRWKLSAIPLGGYVKFFGDENVASVPDANAIAAMNADERRVSFFHKSVGARAAVVAAGPIANFLLAIAIFATIFWVYGKQETAARIGEVAAGSPAAAAGFQPDDVVLSIDGKPINSFREMKVIVAFSAERPLDIVVDRGGAHVTLHATPRLGTEKDKDNAGLGLLGVIQKKPAPEDIRTIRYTPLGALQEAGTETWSVIDQSLTYFARIFVGRASAAQLGGVVRIAQMSGEAASLGFATLMSWAGYISVSIGLLNLFPIPLLDGGHLLFYAAEAVRGRPLSERVQEFGFRIGFAIIVMLMIFTVWNDLSRLWVS